MYKSLVNFHERTGYSGTHMRPGLNWVFLCDLSNFQILFDSFECQTEIFRYQFGRMTCTLLTEYFHKCTCLILAISDFVVNDSFWCKLAILVLKTLFFLQKATLKRSVCLRMSFIFEKMIENGLFYCKNA